MTFNIFIDYLTFKYILYALFRRFNYYITVSQKHTITFLFLSLLSTGFGKFGQNIVQYDDFTWHFIQSKHFDIYYSENGREHAEFTAEEAEIAYLKISDRLNWRLKQRVSIIIYNSHNDFQQTNVIDSYMYEGIGGVTELYKNRVVIPFDASNREFKHVIHHELVHAFINDCVYGGSLRNMLASSVRIQIPMWMNEGLAEYLASGWDTNSEMWIRDMVINGGEFPDINNLNGYMAYRGGQSVWNFITDKWGEESIAEIFYQIKKSNKTVTARVANLGSNNLATDKTVKSTKPWANINGFRSAKFGMTMKEVKKSIRQDFGISDDKITTLIGLSDEEITTINHPTEKTQSLAITIEKLLPDSGKSRVVYVFGYQTKRLIQVNILTGHPVDKKVIAQQVVNSGNLLGNHFFKKRYQEDGLVAHARLSDGSILIFRGKDQKGRMVILRLSNPQSTDENGKDLKISLNLSYIEKPGKPDIYQLREGDF